MQSGGAVPCNIIIIQKIANVVERLRLGGYLKSIQKPFDSSTLWVHFPIVKVKLTCQKLIYKILYLQPPRTDTYW